MITIDDLAAEIADTHGIDSRDAARDVVLVHVDQISDEPHLWDSDTAQLTDHGADVVREAIAQAYEHDQVGTQARNLLDLLGEVAARIRALDEQRTQLVDERDDLVRAAMRTELRRGDIAAAADLKAARLYQIRDRRR